MVFSSLRIPVKSIEKLVTLSNSMIFLVFQVPSLDQSKEYTLVN